MVEAKKIDKTNNILQDFTINQGLETVVINQADLNLEDLGLLPVWRI